MTSRPIAAVILAAGKGTRMKSDLHKVLHPVGGQPMLLKLISEFGHLDLKKSVVVVGADAESVRGAAEADGVSFAYQTEQLGTAHAALQARDALAGFDGDVLICFGDVPLLKAATVERMQQRLVADDAPACVVLGFRPQDPKAYGRVIADDHGRIEKMVEYKDASDTERACTLCNAGPLMARGSEVFNLLARISNDNAQGEYYLPYLVNVAAADGRRSAVVEAPEREVAGVNDRRDLARAEALFQEEQREAMMVAGVSLRAPETVFFSYDTQIASDVVVEPNVVFGPGVTVESGANIRAFSHIEGAHIGPDCEVGPYARLRPGAKLERGAKIGNFVEMKKATLGEGAKANHLTYLGDADVGPRANIGAGTITCNYDGFFKYRTEIGADAFIGSNSALVAPVRIGSEAIVGAGSTVTSDVADGDLRLERADQADKPGWAARFRKAMAEKKARG
ncbi:MAG: bifunctional UDP-N-acetylglucosamine diphosphorylase/glucosamine-1-phosphate N-acetyltransferase GlmU [Pacificimonas sp.]|nr:bifunctional UDP-N-acetylglucosamine diphosphorylase/glucosamine-1-phosphate N-acetyltransferase GlmU [Pacificimonas sp.]